jgi:ketosteroid isomerase-like protein
MQRSPDIESLVQSWFEAANRGDPSIVRAHVSPGEGTRLIGSDATEVFKGGAAITMFLSVEIEGAAGRAQFVARDVEAFEEGTVGWASARLKITMKDGRSVTPRWTAVFHREEGVWKFVQTHVSIGVSNEAVGWTYPE